MQVVRPGTVRSKGTRNTCKTRNEEKTSGNASWKGGELRDITLLDSTVNRLHYITI